ncbi:dihydroorotate dehydrogenase-like protein [Methylocaldum sp. RMAD-M]|jgi:dihydroorotate dehydrogenase (fumarate)|uniref:dihydroorotate dehydrogenase-like protein n=1 Tax=Methylocaldum sp. RMAD-M TaxID=2806557 RepID=UPI000A31F621|nr:dihydroorotate dehydrogenase-like protein [Methylocaldum sp. RMAD-M]MBP1150103.1 dihydroorotate dehydrogenase (fumarate) [Methylocaldum sp. RMAD-M]MDV3243435.1 dihydroorotate dehydrogenase-like protein [Methylocaldum sp.]
MDLKTRYMGLELDHPVVASASPLSETLDGIRRLEDGGVSAVVLFSLFEEQIRQERMAFVQLMDHPSESYAESLSYFPDVGDFRVGPDSYLSLVQRAAEAVDIPVIASLNCVTGEGWIDYARQLQEAGAKALELNIYGIEANFDVSGREVEQRYLDILRMVKQAVSIPVALKLSPFFSAFGHIARQFDAEGADALVLFNRFYQPDLDIVNLEVAPTLSLSHAGEIRLPLLWIALLRGRIKASLAATRGVESAVEIIKYLLAGADVVMVASALLRNGPDYAGTLVDGLRDWMDQRGFQSLEPMRGIMSRAKVANPGAFERANYIKILESY